MGSAVRRPAGDGAADERYRRALQRAGYAVRAVARSERRWDRGGTRAVLRDAGRGWGVRRRTCAATGNRARGDLDAGVDGAGPDVGVPVRIRARISRRRVRAARYAG